jgi:hypothetical protein
VIPITLEGVDEMGEASAFHEGFAQIEKDGKVGYIDKTGKEAIPCKYDCAYNFTEGLAVIMKDDKYGYIDTKGNEVIPCEYDNADSYSEGLALVNKGEKSLFIDKNGKIVIECSYDITYSFHDGLARISKKNDNSFIAGFIDRNGKEIIPCVYETWYDFSDGLVAVSKDGIKGYVDKNGKSTFDYIENEESEEEAYWKNVLVSRSKSALQLFIDRNPGNVHIREAEQIIDSIDFETAKMGDSMESYKKYMEEHEQGCFFDEAKNAYDRLEKELTNDLPSEKEDY